MESNSAFPRIWLLWFNTRQVIPTTIPWLVPGLLNFLDRKILVGDVQHSCGCESDHSRLSTYFHFLGNFLPSSENEVNLVFCSLVTSLLFICDWGIKALNGFFILFLYENINTHYNCVSQIHS